SVTQKGARSEEDPNRATLPGTRGAVVSIVAALVYRIFHYLRGRRDRDHGLPCIRCERTAFPVEGVVTRYRCWNCDCRFDGPEHFLIAGCEGAMVKRDQDHVQGTIP